MTSLDRRQLLTVAIAAAALGKAAMAGAVQRRFAVTRDAAEWRRLLGAQRFHILREAGTERAYSSPFNNDHRKGTFVCAGCTQRLFASSTKFDSGTGWPSFWTSLPQAVVTSPDRSLLMTRNEVRCARCGGHLGHVFEDGPRPTGLRYCINGLALKFATG